MPKTTFAGHPLHPQLVAFPIGLLSYSTVMDALYAATSDQSFADAAYYTLAGGCVSALAAGATGAADYLTIPDGTKSKQMANVHLALNAGVMGLFGMSLFLRRGRQSRSGFLPALLGLLGTAGLVVSQWYGGELVYELGMRVRPMMEGDQSSELKLPGDRRMEEAFRSAGERLAPAYGPND